MSDTETSPEATVAGEAASAAVEELHAREAVAETAADAYVEAAVAADVAVQAEERATDAVEASSVAVEVAVQASEEAQQAQQATEAVAYMSLEAYEAHRVETDEKLREMREYIDSRIPLPTQEPVNQVEEVEVNGGTGNSDSGAGPGTAEGSSSEEGASQKPSARYGLRHKRR